MPAFARPYFCIRATALFAVALLSGCAWWQAPSVDDAVSAPADVIAPASEEVAGQLALTDSGLWALVWKSGQKRDDIKVGDLVRARSLDDSDFEANYAVALTRNWGVLLQRLGGGPVPTEIGDIDITVLDADQMRGACVGNPSSWPGHPCIERAKAPAAWDIYALDADRLAAPSAPDSWGGELPFRRLAIATRTELAPETVETTPWSPSTRWIAVRRQKRRLPSYQPRVAVDTSCSSHRSLLEASDLPTSFVDLGATRDALEVELAAATHRADVLIRCPEDRGLVISAPSVFRPLLDVAYANFRGVSLLGWRAIEISPENREAVGLSVELMAAMATGRFDRADFYTDRLLPRLPDKRARRLALLAAPTAASAELPETTLRRMKWGAERIWNPERDIAYQLARAWGWAGFDRPRRALVEMQAVDELVAKSRADASVQRWRAWTELRAFAASYSRRSSAEDGFRQGRAYFEDIPGTQSWREAVDWLRWSGLGGAIPRVEGADTRFDVFRAAASGEASGCSNCRLDPYGRDAVDWANGLSITRLDDALDTIGRLPLLAVSPGLTRLAVTKSATSELPLVLHAGWVTFAPERALGESLGAMVDAMGATLRCEATAPGIAGQKALARVLGFRAAQRDESRLMTARWVATTGLDLACRDASELVARVAEKTRKKGAESVLLTRFTTRALAASADQALGAADARRMAEAAKAGSLPEVCMLWNQAASLAAMQSGRIKAAEAFLLSSVDCHDGEAAVDLDATEAYLGALLHYERTRRIPGQLDADVERRLAIATRHRLRQDDTCAGTSDFGYWMSAGVSRRVAGLSERLRMEPPPEDDGLALRTASKTAARAAASYHAARRSLGEARPALAARHLRDARRDFGTVAHQPGLARTQWLIDVVFGADFAGFVEREPAEAPNDPGVDAAETRDAQTLLRNGRARAVLDDERVEAEPSMRLAAALILGREATVARLIDQHATLQESLFCEGVR